MVELPLRVLNVRESLLLEVRHRRGLPLRGVLVLGVPLVPLVLGLDTRSGSSDSVELGLEGLDVGKEFLLVIGTG